MHALRAGQLPHQATCSHTNSSSSNRSSSGNGHHLAAHLHGRRAHVHTGPLRRDPQPQPARQYNSSSPRHTSGQLLAVATAHAAAATSAPAGPRVLYPQLSPHDSGYLKVSARHTLYYEVYGNPRGVPALVVHGGPGAGCYPNHARFFDPAHYRIILVDQRGCGRSTPYGCLADNTTADLVNDLEQLRRSLGVQQWLMLGGSWGVTLTLAYAQAFPASVLGIILRGVCLMRPQEISWMFGGGAAALKPLGWLRFLQPLSAHDRSNPLLAYYQGMLNSDANVRGEAAKSWSGWEMFVSSSSQNVAVWDGQQWGEQAAPATPQQQQQPPQGGQCTLPPPPRPVGPAAISAAAAAAGGLMPLLHRDLTGSPWFSTLQQQQQQPACTTTQQPALVSASAGAAQQHGSSSSNNTGALQRPRHRKGGPAADIGSIHSDCTITTIHQQAAAAAGIQPQQPQQQQQQAEELQLIQWGLQHAGFKQGGHAQSLLTAHYSVHGAFLQQQPLLDHIGRVRHIPCIAVQGQWDLVCPPTTAVELGQAWPEMELRLVPRAGHSMYDPAITHELVTATDRMRALQPAAPAAGVGLGGTTSQVAGAVPALAGVC